MLERGVAQGVHRVEDAHTNWYLIEEDSRLTVVDCGLPRSWSSLEDSLRQIGHSARDIEAVVLTHGHFDHVGFAHRAQRELGVSLWAHRDEVTVVSHPWRYQHERSRIPYLRHDIPQGLLRDDRHGSAVGEGQRLRAHVHRRRSP